MLYGMAGCRIKAECVAPLSGLLEQRVILNRDRLSNMSRNSVEPFYLTLFNICILGCMEISYCLAPFCYKVRYFGAEDPIIVI